MGTVEEMRKIADDYDLPYGSCIIAKVAAVDSVGTLLIAFPNSKDRSVPARVVSTVDLQASELIGRNVLVVFASGKSLEPVVVGIVQDKVELNADAISQGSDGDEEPLIIESSREIQIKCGKGSIVLRKDGSIIIRGTRLVSRASEDQRIRGATVRIN